MQPNVTETLEAQKNVGWDKQRESQHCVAPVAGITLRPIPAYNYNVMSRELG